MLKFLVLDHPMSASAIAERVGISGPHLSLVLSGRRGLSLPVAIRAGRFFRVSPEALPQEITTKQIMLVIRARLRESKGAD